MKPSEVFDSQLAMKRFRIKYISTYNDEVLHEATNPDTEILYVEIADVKYNEGITTKTLFAFENAPSRARRIVRHGDVIISTVRTYLKAVASIKNPESNLIVSTGFAVFRPNRLLFDSDFAGFYFLSNFFLNKVVSMSVGVSYPAVSPEDIASLEVFLPPLPVQQAIAAFLDKETARIDALIAKKECQIELLQEKRQAVITRAVTKGLDPNAKMKDSGVEWIGEIPEGWEVRRLKYLSEIRFSNVDKHSQEDESEVFLCNYIDVYKNETITSDLNFMRATAKPEEILKFTLREGQIIITKDSETPDDIGVPAIVKTDMEKLICGYHLAIITSKSMCQSDYIFRALQSTLSRCFYETRANGITRFSIGIDAVGDCPIAYPKKIEEQLSIIQYILNEVSRIEKILLRIEETVTLLREYRSSLITAAVSGQINVSREAVK